MSTTAVDFLYLSEPDMILAGVQDINRCVDVMGETLVLLRKGDFRMAGSIAMSHGAAIRFPKDPEFPGMPADGPDRRFMAMPAYLGGRFGTTGVKWYGSNVENREKGLPRSIHLFILNDTDTGAPLAVMSANLISAYRTGAMPGLATKYLARKDARTLGVVGPGVIGRVVTEAVLGQRPSIERIVAKGVDDADVQRFANAIRLKFPQIKSVESAGSVEQVIRESDVVTSTTAGPGDPPHIKCEWVKPGALITLPAKVSLEEELLTSTAARTIVDSWQLYESYYEEYGEGAYQTISSQGVQWHRLVAEGKMQREQIEELADIVTDDVPGRQNDDEIFITVAGGMPVQDVAWATDVYNTAVERNIGISLNLWDSPALA